MRFSPTLRQILVWGLTGPLLILNLWIFSQIFRYFERLITILIVAATLAFLLNYPVRLLEWLRLRRPVAVGVVLLFTATLLIVLGVTVVPIVAEQFGQLINRVPGWLNASRQNLEQLRQQTQPQNLMLDLGRVSIQVQSQLENQLQNLAKPVLDFALGTLSGLVDSLMVFVLTFYTLLYGRRLWEGFIELLPKPLKQPLSSSLKSNFHNFLISQLLLALFMVVTLAPIFLWLQVPFFLVFALMIGVANLIPLVGATIGIGLTALILLLQSFWLSFWVTLAAIVIQQIKDNVLAPRLMGDITGLNPLVIFVAVLVGGQLSGLLGVLLAVPLAGTIKGTIEQLRDPQKANDN